MHDPRSYQVTLKYVTSDGVPCYSAKVREFSDLEDFGASPGDAIELLLESISALQEMLRSQGKVVPAPIEEPAEDFSGRVTLRLGKQLHRAAALAAEWNQVSLNSWLTQAVATYAEYTRLTHAPRSEYTPVTYAPLGHLLPKAIVGVCMSVSSLDAYRAQNVTMISHNVNSISGALAWRTGSDSYQYIDSLNAYSTSLS